MAYGKKGLTAEQTTQFSLEFFKSKLPKLVPKAFWAFQNFNYLDNQQSQKGWNWS